MSASGRKGGGLPAQGTGGTPPRGVPRRAFSPREDLAPFQHRVTPELSDLPKLYTLPSVGKPPQLPAFWPPPQLRTGTTWAATASALTARLRRKPLTAFDSYTRSLILIFLVQLMGSRSVDRD